MTFGERVRQFRQLRSMTQAALAETVGLTRTSITNIESGVQNPPLTLIHALADALDVPTGLLFEGTDDDQLTDLLAERKMLLNVLQKVRGDLDKALTQILEP
jgi:transcriptional regulator with XRE-family HTH domain